MRICVAIFQKRQKTSSTVFFVGAVNQLLCGRLPRQRGHMAEVASTVIHGVFDPSELWKVPAFMWKRKLANQTWREKWSFCTPQLPKVDLLKVSLRSLPQN